MFERADGKHQAILNVRFSPKLFEELIQFEVELGSVDVSDKVSKNIAVQWKMLDDFDQRGTFFTDSNGLGMLERNYNHKKSIGGSQPLPLEPSLVEKRLRRSMRNR